MAKRRGKSNEELTNLNSTTTESIDKKDDKYNQSRKNLKNKKEIKQLGTLPVFKNQRFWARFVIILGVISIVYFTSLREKEKKFALQKENIPYRMQKLQCSTMFTDEISAFPKCIPKTCGRFVTDSIISSKEVDMLLKLAKSIFKYGQSSGGASIFDLTTGALSQGTEFINFFKNPKSNEIITGDVMNLYKIIKSKIQHVIADTFDIEEKSIYLTNPTFFSRITNVTAKTLHDEYWHSHIDKETYNSFHYTSLLYLSDHSKEFEGGRFVFVDGKDRNRTISTIEPKKGRLLLFTSGAENVHYVEKVTKGIRFAATISFTCNKEFAIQNEQFQTVI